MSQIDHILPAGADPPRRLDHIYSIVDSLLGKALLSPALLTEGSQTRSTGAVAFDSVRGLMPKIDNWKSKLEAMPERPIY
jgi:hypothetical protein